MCENGCSKIETILPLCELYLGAFISQASPAEHVASLFCCESYARWDVDARVNGTGQRPGQGRAGHTSVQLPIIHLLSNEKLNKNVSFGNSRYSLLWWYFWKLLHMNPDSVLPIPLFITQMNFQDTANFIFFFKIVKVKWTFLAKYLQNLAMHRMFSYHFAFW